MMLLMMCIICTWEEEAEESGVQGHPQLLSEFELRDLSYETQSQKKPKQQKMKDKDVISGDNLTVTLGPSGPGHTRPAADNPMHTGHCAEGKNRLCSLRTLISRLASSLGKQDNYVPCLCKL